MKVSELNKFKKELETKLKNIISLAKDDGIDTDSFEFGYKMDKLKKDLIAEKNIGLSQYEQAELLAEIEKDIREAKILAQTQKVDWNEIENKPDFFHQEDIFDLSFSQLDHKDADHIGIIKSIQNISIDNLDIKSNISTQRKDIDSILNKVEEPEIPLSHDELLGLTPDNHHKELHNLENHIDSKLKHQLERMVTGEYVDDLHKHFVDKNEVSRIIDIAGITKNDADSWYARFEQITTPSNPSSGYTKLYFKSDDKLYKLTSAGVETEIGAGGSVSAHASLTQLDYASAGHTGFQPAGSYLTSSTGLLLDQTTPQTMVGLDDGYLNLVSGVITSTTIPSQVDDTAYGIAWSGVTGTAPSQNAVYNKIEGLPGGHSAVTLDANAQTLLTLSTQELGLGTHVTKTFLAGPTSGSDAVPTFRTIGADDLPDLSGVYSILAHNHSTLYVPLAFKTTLDAVTGIIKGDGAGVYSAASAGTDYQAPLGFTAENVANKDTTVTLGSSNTYYPSQLAVKTYVDTQVGAVVSGQIPKLSCRVATVVAGTLASSFENGDTVDTVTLVTGDRILIKNQADATTNGIYTVNASGAPTRATDYDASGEVTAGTFTFIELGSQTGQQWIQTTQNPTLGSSNLVFTQVGTVASYTASLGVQKVGNDFRADFVANDGLKLSTNSLTINYDNSSLGIVSNALAVKALGVTNAMLAGSIADTKLNQITTASKVSGAAITLLTSLPSGAGKVPTANLGTGTPDSTTFLRGDQSWAVPAGAGAAGVATLNYTKALTTDITSTTVTNTASITTIYTYTVPANTLGTNKTLRILVHGTYLNNSGATKTLTATLSYGGTALISKASGTNASNASTGSFVFEFLLSAKGATNAQQGYLFADMESGAGTTVNWQDVGSSAVDSTSDQTLLVRVTHSVANANTTLISKLMTIELLNATDTIGAPTDASYITLAANANLSNERVLTGTTNQITITDGGANNPVTLSIPSTFTLPTATPTFANVVDSGLTASKVVFTDSGKQLTSTGIGTSSQFIKGDGSLDSSTYLTAVTAHNLLSTTHGDTTADTVIRGDIITGQGSTPKWVRLAFPSTPTGKVLQATATDVAWSSLPLTIGASASVAGSNTGDQVVPVNEGGTTHQFLTAYNSSTGAWSKSALASSDIPTNTSYKHVTFSFQNAGSALATGIVGVAPALGIAGTLVAAYLTSADGTSGSCTVDIWRHNAAVPTTYADSIIAPSGTGGTLLTLSSGTYGKTTTFTSWNSTTFAADDVITLNLATTSTLKYLTITLVINPS